MAGKKPLRDTFDIFMEEKKILHPSCPHPYLCILSSNFSPSSYCGETLQGCCIDRSGAFSLLPTHSTKKCVRRHHIPVKLFFCHSQNSLDSLSWGSDLTPVKPVQESPPVSHPMGSCSTASIQFFSSSSKEVDRGLYPQSIVLPSL